MLHSCFLLLLLVAIIAGSPQLCPRWDGNSVLADGATVQLYVTGANGNGFVTPTSLETGVLALQLNNQLTDDASFTWTTPVQTNDDGVFTQMAILTGPSSDGFTYMYGAIPFGASLGDRSVVVLGSSFYFAIIGSNPMYFIYKSIQSVIQPLVAGPFQFNATLSGYALFANAVNSGNSDPITLYVCNGNPNAHVTIQAPSFIQVAAVENWGAVVTYPVSATDTDTHQSVPVTCTRPPGARFEYATSTTVECTATGSVGASKTVFFNVVVTPKYYAEYKGCYADQSVRDLIYQYASAEADVEECLAFCADQGYKYAGLQYADECYCGNTFGKYGTSTACTMNCAGDATEKCGGSWANSIYAAHTNVAPYLGCYSDSSIRDLPFLFTQYDLMTVEFCRAGCRSQGYEYAGVQYSTQCFCGHTFGNYGELLDSNCLSTCGGNSAEYCGGSWANSVYST